MSLPDGKSSSHTRAIVGALAAFVAIATISMAVVLLSFALQGVPLSFLISPSSWLQELDHSTAFDVVTNGAEMLAAILAIAITVVAIVVELAANRYSHKITSHFVREPINIVVMTFFVVATIQSIWIGLSLGDPGDAESFPKAGLVISIFTVTMSLVILLPYFAFVLSFLSPISFIEKIRADAFKAIRRANSKSMEKSKMSIQDCVDELQDISRRASELSDRAVAMASINALSDLLLNYERMTRGLPESWFHISESVANDPDFVSLSSKALEEVESGGTWVEVKIMRQYLDLISDSNPSARDTTYLIAINTKRIGVAAIGKRPPVVELCIHCFNSYLRATINNGDQRTSYYIMNQYRQLAERLLHHGDTEIVREIALHFQFYGLLGFKAQIPFLLEVAAYDLTHLIEECARVDSELIDPLLGLLLELDQDIKEEFQEDSLLGVRRTQVQLATYFVEHGDKERALRICRDLKVESEARREQLRNILVTESRPQYWEFTDRGVNFSYLSPPYRRHVDTIFEWIDDA